MVLNGENESFSPWDQDKALLDTFHCQQSAANYSQCDYKKTKGQK